MFDFRNDSTPAPTADEKIAALRDDLDSMTKLYNRADAKVTELHRMIKNVNDHILDVYAMNGSLDEDIKAIAELLDIALTKRITGSYTVEIEFSADVPLDFDNDDFALSYEISCDSYEADNFDYSEVNADWTVEDEV